MNLQEFFKENPKVALAFSGGVDSSYLLYAAMKYGADVKAYYVKALFHAPGRAAKSTGAGASRGCAFRSGCSFQPIQPLLLL